MCVRFFLFLTLRVGDATATNTRGHHPLSHPFPTANPHHSIDTMSQDGSAQDTYRQKIMALELSPEPETSGRSAYLAETQWDKYRLNHTDFKKWKDGAFPEYAPLENASRGSQLPQISPNLPPYAFKYVDCKAIGRSVPVTTHPFVASAHPDVSVFLYCNLPVPLHPRLSRTNSTASWTRPSTFFRSRNRQKTSRWS